MTDNHFFFLVVSCHPEMDHTEMNIIDEVRRILYLYIN
jgi:hypothetical protein